MPGQIIMIRRKWVKNLQGNSPSQTASGLHGTEDLLVREGESGLWSLVALFPPLG